MPTVYSWLPVLSAPLIDRKGFTLLDPVYPNQLFKAIHMEGPKGNYIFSWSAGV